MPYVVAIVLIITIGITVIVTRALEYREKVDMLQHGFVPKGYAPRANQPTNPTSANPPQIAAPAQPPQPLSSSWNAQDWREGVPVGERAKEDRAG